MTIQLEVGKYYRNRRGGISGPMMKNLTSVKDIYPFWDDSTIAFMRDGSFSEHGQSFRDLVSECDKDGNEIKQEIPMSKSEDTKVGELLDVLREWNPSLFRDGQAWETSQSAAILKKLKLAIDALRPKPKKFYVMPTWVEFSRGQMQNLQWNVLISRAATHNEDEKLWDAIREATSTDKFLCHIPRGEDWSDEDREALLSAWGGGKCVQEVMTAAINAIKAKCEAGQ
jgi:hypothetical protein